MRKSVLVGGLIWVTVNGMNSFASEVSRSVAGRPSAPLPSTAIYCDGFDSFGVQIETSQEKTAFVSISRKGLSVSHTGRIQELVYGSEDRAERNLLPMDRIAVVFDSGETIVLTSLRPKGFPEGTVTPGTISGTASEIASLPLPAEAGCIFWRPNT